MKALSPLDLAQDAPEILGKLIALKIESPLLAIVSVEFFLRFNMRNRAREYVH